MYANPDLMEQLSRAYRQRRTAECEVNRQLRLAGALTDHQPAWSSLVLLLGRGLISIGERLEKWAGPQPQPRCETS